MFSQRCEFSSPATRGDRAEPSPCDSRERQGRDTSLGRHCHIPVPAGKGRAGTHPWESNVTHPREGSVTHPREGRAMSLWQQGSVTSLRRNCHMPGKAELTTLRPGDTSSSVLAPRACQAPAALPALRTPALDCAQCPAAAALIFWEKQLFPADNECSRTANDCSQMIMAVPSPAGHGAAIPLDKDTHGPGRGSGKRQCLRSPAQGHASP